MAKSKATVQAEDLRVQADSYEVIVEPGKKRWPLFAGISAILLIIILASLFIIQVPVITEETYYETIEETIISEPRYEPVTIQKPITKTETYYEEESYMPTREFTTEECGPIPLEFTYETIGDLSKQEWNVATKTGWTDRPGKYNKRVIICNTNPRVTPKDLIEKGPLFSRDIEVRYQTCNKGAPTKTCSYHEVDLMPDTCEERLHEWTSIFVPGRDIIFSDFSTSSTEEKCMLVTKDIPLDEFHKQLGSFNPEKDYTETKKIEKTREVTEYIEEIIEQEIPGEEKTIEKQVPRTRQKTTNIPLWEYITSS